ncbi:bifunctional 2-polyprenyl-6-hydroxyphenol methylase/3-demethylubiquinol 3-O-methyltransferase UbiG [Dyella sp. C9]|uniref:class I SAM-dependent methyltransferase n=1 Tax=Dyella sp. C9 TaxID=2202154 RepID=UPI000DEEE4C0|nr:methyltransferase domain-containing protein [Dyella sp. C9]
MLETMERKPHADISNMPLRTLKARKIELLLGLDHSPAGGSLLEVGTGSGGIAHYFACQVPGQWRVSAVDVIDNRQLTEGYEFRLIDGCALPYADRSFDVVISNHVIEHVGDEASQLIHLRELKRVLKPGGQGYLAVPNRWMVMEPHFRVPLLSWLPRSWRSPYLRLAGKGEHYDCEPLTMGRAERLIEAAGLHYANVGLAALRATVSIERPAGPVIRWLAGMPDGLLKPGLPIMPTLIYRVWRGEGDAI